MSFVTDIFYIGVCPGFWINKKNRKVHSPGLQSPNIGYATLLQSALWAFMMIPSQMAFKVKLFEYSVTTVTNSSSSWAYQPTPNLTLLLFTAVSSSNYESIPTPFVMRTLLFHWFLPRCYFVEQCSQTTLDQRAILQKRDNSPATSH